MCRTDRMKVAECLGQPHQSNYGNMYGISDPVSKTPFVPTPIRRPDESPPFFFGARFASVVDCRWRGSGTRLLPPRLSGSGPALRRRAAGPPRLAKQLRSPTGRPRQAGEAKQGGQAGRPSKAGDVGHWAARGSWGVWPGSQPGGQPGRW